MSITRPTSIGADAGNYAGVLNSTVTESVLSFNSVDYNVVTVAVDVSGLKKYANGYGQMGYWVGFHVNPPAGAVKLLRSYTGYDDETTFEALMAKEVTEYTDLATEGNFQSYPDVYRQKERWIRLQWFDASDNLIEETVYHLDCTAVKLYTEYNFVDKTGLSFMMVDVFNKVNQRIEERITTTIDSSSDDKHVASAKSVYEMLQNISAKVEAKLSIKTVTGDINELVTEPASNIVYFQRDNESDTTWNMYVWQEVDGAFAWAFIGTSDLNLDNCYTKVEIDTMMADKVDNDQLAKITNDELQTIVDDAFTATSVF